MSFEEDAVLGHPDGRAETKKRGAVLLLSMLLLVSCDGVHGSLDDAVLLKLPADGCDGCRVVNTGVWSNSAGEVQVAGNLVAAGAQCECRPHVYVKSYDSKQWTSRYESAAAARSLRKTWLNPESGVYFIENALGPNGGSSVRSLQGDDIRSIGVPREGYYRDIWGSAAADIFLVGSGGAIDHFDGEAWSSQGGPTDASLAAVWGASAQHVFAAGEKGTMLRFDGSAWQRVELDIDADLNGIWGSSADEVYMVGGSDHPDGTTGPGIVVRYDGMKGTTVHIAPDDALLDVHGSRADEVFAVGGTRAKGGGVQAVVWHFDGRRWTRLLPRGVEAFLSDVWCAAKGECYAVGASDRIVVLHGLP